MRYLLPLLFGFSSVYSQLRFEEVSSELNFNHTFFSQTFGGAGLSFVDFDNDGLDDITIPVNQDKTIYFYKNNGTKLDLIYVCLLYTSPSPRDRTRSRMPSSA